MNPLTGDVARHAREAPDSIAIVQGDRRISYADFWAQATGYAGRLVAGGLQPGERVAIILPNSIEAAVAIYGIWLAGGVVVALNAQARAHDLGPWLRHCGAVHAIHEETHGDALEALSEARCVRGSTCVAPGTPLSAMGADARPQGKHGHAVPARSIAAIVYTSGTTGAPKGVTLTHDNIRANVDAVADYLALERSDIVLSVLPFYYAYGASVLHTHMARGACVVLAPNLLFPAQVMEVAARERVTGLSGVPSTFALLLRHARWSEYDLSALRYITQAGGAMSPALTRELVAAAGTANLYVMYGQTESTSRISWLRPDLLSDRIGSVGLPIEGLQWRVVRDDATLCDCGEDGELQVRGTSVMLGYWNDPAATASVLQDGWLRTGDVGHLDADGYLYLSGRRSDMIKTGAHRVHPADVEEVIGEVPGVTEVAVVGVDDEVLGQVIKAYVVAPTRPPRAEDLIRAHCRTRLANYKIPRHITFVDALPRTASGKIRRVQLMEFETAP